MRKMAALKILPDLVDISILLASVKNETKGKMMMIQNLVNIIKFRKIS